MRQYYVAHTKNIVITYHVNGDFANFDRSMALAESLNILLLLWNFLDKSFFQCFIGRKVAGKMRQNRKRFLNVTTEKKKIPTKINNKLM